MSYIYIYIYNFYTLLLGCFAGVIFEDARPRLPALRLPQPRPRGRPRHQRAPQPHGPAQLAGRGAGRKSERDKRQSEKRESGVGGRMTSGRAAVAAGAARQPGSQAAGQPDSSRPHKQGGHRSGRRGRRGRRGWQGRQGGQARTRWPTWRFRPRSSSRLSSSSWRSPCQAD